MNETSEATETHSPEPTDAWKDDRTNKVDEDGCLVCSKPTRSHVLLIAHEDGDMVPVESTEAADGFGVVCHTCYEEHDGVADNVAQAYNDRLDAALAPLDVTKEDLAKNPIEAHGHRYECQACGDVVGMEDVEDHGCGDEWKRVDGGEDHAES